MKVLSIKENTIEYSYQILYFEFDLILDNNVMAYINNNTFK